MLDDNTMLKLAKDAITNAPNDDWKNRGCFRSGNLSSVIVRHYDNKEIGIATCGYFVFEKHLKDDFNRSGWSPFVGFTLAAMETQGKLISATRPVITNLENQPFSSNGLEHRFCPQCHSLDSVKSKSKKMGPECIRITYKCKKCSYTDIDVMD